MTGFGPDLTLALDAFNQWVLDLIAGTQPGIDVVAAFQKVPTEALESLYGSGSYFHDFCLYELSKRRGALLEWKVEIKSRGRAVVSIKPKAAIEFITLTTTIGDKA